MKRIMKLLAAVSLASLLLMSCEKEGPARFNGNWSFKTSGTVVMKTETKDTTSKIPGIILEEKRIKVPTESGQMDIVTTNKKEGAMLITMNATLGDAIVIEATAEDKDITLVPFKRTLKLRINELMDMPVEVEISGYGKRYDDTIILYLACQGEFTYLATQYTLTESDVKCVAKLNDY